MASRGRGNGRPSRSKPMRHAGSASRAHGIRARAREWWELPDEQLLDLRACDLGLTIEGTALETRVEALQAELVAKGLRFRPYVWLSSDWFTPDDATGFAIPFFLAHPRLVRLERNQMLEAEGGTHGWCMKLLRHETAHALDNAYGLRRRKIWRETFGRSSEPYRASYTPDPTSREYVLNLDYWYSQSHPLEDWAETFAVWLDPRSAWRRRYAGWPALRKLETVDAMMRDLARETPILRTRHREETLAQLRDPLRELYARKRAQYDPDPHPDLDQRLSGIFVAGGTGRTAGEFFRRSRRLLVERIARTTGQHRYLVDHALRELALRSRARRLRVAEGGDERETLLDVAVLLTTLTLQFLHGGHPRYHR